MVESPVFPPNAGHGDLVDGLADAWKAWRRDDGLRARAILESLLDAYPWSTEALALYGTVVAATRHCFSPSAYVRLYEWAAIDQAAKGIPSEMSEAVERFTVMRDWLRQWLSWQARTYNRNREPLPWASVLDVASADGAMAVHWLKVPGVASVTCLDLTYLHIRQGIDHRGKIPGLSFIRAMGDFLPVRDASYDVVILAGILEHVPAPHVFVAEARRALRPGGLLLVQTPWGGTGHRDTDPQGHPLLVRFHVNAIDPWTLGGDWARLLWTHTIDYTNSIQNPHSFEGNYYDLVAAYEKTA